MSGTIVASSCGTTRVRQIDDDEPGHVCQCGDRPGKVLAGRLLEKLRSVIDTITSKVVLILGRFTPEREVVLDAIRDQLRKRDYLPVLFDFVRARVAIYEMSRLF